MVNHVINGMSWSTDDQERLDDGGCALLCVQYENKAILEHVHH